MSFSYGQTTLWFEDFESPTVANDLTGTATGVNATTWAATGDTHANTNRRLDVASVGGSLVMRARNTDEVETWATAAINITGYTNVTFSLDAAFANVEGSDSFTGQYRVDGGTYIDFQSATTTGVLSSYSVAGLSGSTLEIRVQFQTNDNSDFEYYYIDNILVEGTTGGSSCTTQSLSPGTAIPDGNLTGISETVSFSTTGPITDVNVTLDITHPFDADLDITLTSPGGTTIILSSDNGGGGNNYTNTVFDDAAVTAITAGTAPFTGTFSPEQALSNFNGENPNGVWTLTVVDDFGADAGTLNSFSIEVCEAAPISTADIEVNKTVNDATPEEGDTITYTLTVDNNGPDQATNVSLIDILPAGVTYVSDDGAYVSGTGVWTIGTLNNGATATLNIVANVDFGTGGSTITNTITAVNLDQTDSNATADVLSVDITPVVVTTDLEVTKTVNDSTPLEGDNITYTLEVSNNGPNQVTNLSLIDILPAGVTFVSDDGAYISGTGVWTIGTLNSGAIATLNIVASVDIGTSGSTITNTITAVNLDQTDNNVTADDLSQDIVPTVNPTLSIDNVTVNEGGNAVFTVTLTGTASGSFTVDYTTTDNSATAGTDFTLTSGQLSFSGTAGQSLTITVPTNTDALFESTETYFVDLSNISGGGVAFNDAQGLGTINDTNALSVDNGGANTCGGVFTDSGGTGGAYANNENHTFYLNPDTGGSAVSLNFTSFDVEAGFDFLYAYNGVGTGSLIGVFENGNVPTTITSTDPSGGLTLVFTSDGSVTGTGWTANVSCSVLPTTGLSINNRYVNESAGTATFTVTNTGVAVGGGFSVNYATSDNSALAGSDYVSSSGTLVFTGTLNESQTITVPINDDAIFENDEQFNVTLSGLTTGAISLVNAIGIGIIGDNDVVVAPDQPLVLVEQFNGYTDYVSTGNTLRQDSNAVDPCTIVASSNNTLTSPLTAGATLRKAYLYWTHSGTVPDVEVTFEGTTVNASTVYSTGSNRWFSMRADVTTIVDGVLNPSTNVYDFSDLTIDNTGSYCSGTVTLGGWSLVIFYADPVLPAASINLYEGFAAEQSSSSSYPLSGFYANNITGAKATFLSWEGDPDITGSEVLSITNQAGTTTTLSGDGAQTGNNPFNSTIYDNTVGPIVNNTTTYGLDLDTYDISSFISTGDNIITANLQSGGDLIIPNAVIIRVPSNLIAGTVFEDVNYGGGSGRNQATSGGIALENVTVELYDNTNTLVQTTTTDSSGEYFFGGMTSGSYNVRVVNSTVSSSRTGGFTCATCLPIQTFRRTYTASIFTDVSNEVGGANPANEDVAAGTFVGAQSLSSVVIGNEGIVGINFGFNFNTVVNTNATGQGSLAQFITNSNNLGNTGLDIETNSIFNPGAGEDTSVFMIPSSTDPLSRTADSNFSGGIFTITQSTQLPAITDVNTFIDGRTQTANIGDTNAGTVQGIEQPEIQIDGSTNGDVFTVQVNDITIRNLSIYGTGNDGISVESGTSSDPTIITENLIGVNADGTVATLLSNGVEVTSAGLVQISNNYITLNSNNGIRLLGNNSSASSNIISANGSAGVVFTGGNTSGNLISQNSIYNNGTSADALGIDISDDGVTLNDSGDGDTGPNTSINFPVFDGPPIVDGTDLVIRGWARPGSIIEFFLTDIAEGTADEGDNQIGLTQDYGEGQTYITTLTEGSGSDLSGASSNYLDADGNTDTTNEFEFRIPLPSGVTINSLITATATIGNSTSEFASTALVDGDNDNDGVLDRVDLDDDNDGILDSVECGNSILWVTNGTASTEEQNAIDKLTALGYTITVVDDSVGGDANNFDVVFVFEDANSGTAFANIANLVTTSNGVILSENALHDEVLGAPSGGSSATNFVNITNNSHPITIGLPLGNYNIGDGSFHSSSLGSGTTLGLHPNGEVSLAIWEAGDAMDVGTAPGRRAIVPHSNSNGGINGAGENLLVNAIIWVAGRDSDLDGNDDCVDLDSDGDGCNDVIEAGFTDDNDDGILGPATVTVDANGLVTSGSDGYTIPLDGDSNGTFDFQEAGSAPVIDTQPTNEIICAGDNGSFTVAATGSNLTYQWQISINGGSTFSNLSNGGVYSGVTTNTLNITGAPESLSTNQYRVVVGNSAYICGDIISDEVVLTVPDVSTTVGGTNPSTCSGTNGSITLGGLTIGAIYSISYLDDGTPVGPNNFTADGAGQIAISGLDAGIYSNIIPTLSGCSGAAVAFTLSDPALPTAGISSSDADNSICAGDSVTFTASGGTNYNFLLNSGSVQNSASTTYITTSLSNGDQVSVIVTNGNSCIATSVTITTTVDPLPNAGTDGVLTLCTGDTATLAQLNTAITGEDGGGVWSPAFAPGVTTYTYTVAATGTCTVDDTSTVTVTYDPLPNAGTDGVLTLCTGDTATLAQLNTAITGEDGGGVWSPAFAPGVTTYTYTVAATGTCTVDDTSTVTVTYDPLPNAGTDGVLTLCTGDTATLAQLNTAITGEDGGGVWSPAFAPGVTTYTYTVAATGTCTVDDTSTVTVTYDPLPNAGTDGVLTLCTGDTATLAQLNTAITGEDGGGVWSPAFAPGVTTYTYTVAATGTCTVDDTSTVTVTYDPLPNAGTDGVLTLCTGDTATLAQLNTAITGEDGGGVWSPAFAPGVTTYTYTVAATGTCTVDDTSTVTVTYDPLPNAGTDGVLTLCTGDTATLAQLNTAITGEDGGGVWSPAFAPGVTTYTYTVAATGTCTVDDTSTVTVTYDPLPNAGTDGVLTLCTGDTATLAQLNTAITGEDGGGVWSPAFAPGVTTYTYTVAATGTCTVDDTSTVTVTYDPLPNAGTDGVLTLCTGDTATLAQLNTAITGEDGGGVWSPAFAPGVTTYTYTVAATGTCTVDDTSTVTVTYDPLPNAGTDGVLTLCTGDTATLAQLNTAITGEDGGGVWSPAFAPGVTTYTYTVAATGTCTVDDTSTVTVTYDPLPNAGTDGVLTLCTGDTATLAQLNTAITGEDGGGVWSPAFAPGVTTYTYTVAATGTCTVDDTSTVTVTYDPLPNAGTDGVLTLCTGDTATLAQLNTAITGEDGGGVWSPAFAPGVTTYTYTVAATGTCTVDDTSTVTVTYDPLPNAGTDGVLTLCTGDTATLAQLNTAITGEDGGGVWSPAFAPGVTTYTYTVAATGTCTVDDTSTVTVTYDPLPNAGTDGVLTLCTGDTATLAQLNTAITGEDGGGVWSPAFAPGVTTYTYTVAATGTCTVDDTSTVTVTYDPLPNAGTDGVLTLCTGDTATLAQLNTAITGEDGGGVWSPAFAPGVTTYTYTVAATGTCTVDDTSTVTVTYDPLPNAGTDGVLTLCTGDTATLAQLNTAITGEDGGGVWSPAFAPGVTTYTYTVAATGTCTVDDTSTVTVTYDPLPNAGTDGVLTLCTGDTATLAQLNTAITGEDGGGVWSPAFAPGVTTYTYTVAATGTCTVDDTSTVTVTYDPLPNAGTDGVLTLCTGDTATLAQLNTAITGEDGGGVWSPAFAPGVTTYTYTVAATGTCTVDDTSTVTVTYDPLPNAGTDGVLTLCTGDTATLAQLNTAITGEDGGGVWSPAFAPGVTTYTYTVAATGTCTVDDTSTVTVTYDPLPNAGTDGVLTLCTGDTATLAQLNTAITGEDGGGVWSPAFAPGVTTYTYTVAATGTCTVDDTSTVTVTYDPLPNAGTDGVLTLCTGDTATLAQLNTAITGEDGGGVWSPAFAPGVTTYTYTVAATGTCTVDDTSTVTVTINALPTATISYNGAPFCTTGTVSVTQTGQAGGTYSSTGGLVINAVTGEINLAASTPGIYTVTYSFSDANGCTNTATTSITIVACTADLSLTKTVNNSRPSIGDTIIFTITVTNSGPFDVLGVQVRDIIPAGLINIVTTPSIGTYTIGTGIWDLSSSLANGGTATLTISVEVGPSCTSITNTAEIISSGFADPDSTPNNGG